MKRIFLFILCCIASIAILHATEANKCYKIDISSSDTVIIWVEDDGKDTIFLQEIVDSIAPGKKVYGDDYKDDSYGSNGRLYSDYNTLLNRYIRGYTNSSGGKESPKCPIAQWNQQRKMYILADCNDTISVYKFYHTKFHGNYGISFQFKKVEPNSSESIPSNIEESGEELGVSTPVKGSGDTPCIEKTDTPKWLVIWMSILSVVVLVWCIFVTRRLITYKTYYDKLLIKENDLSTRIKSLEKQIFTEDQVRQLIIDTQKQTDTAKDKEIKQTGTTTHVEKVRTQPLPTKPKEPKIELLDTTDVECNLENDFFSLKHNDKPMFRIYQKGDVFYYSLIEEIKKDMPSMLGGTEKFITVNRSTSSIPQGVEVVKEGIVINEGNGIFRVDSNNKLVINII